MPKPFLDQGRPKRASQLRGRRSVRDVEPPEVSRAEPEGVLPSVVSSLLILVDQKGPQSTARLGPCFSQMDLMSGGDDGIDATDSRDEPVRV